MTTPLGPIAMPTGPDEAGIRGFSSDRGRVHRPPSGLQVLARSTMRLFGIPARVPSFGECTAASILACGLWLGACGLLYRLGSPLAKFDAGALLLILEWTCVSIRAGIEPRLGGRHLIANLAGCAAVIGAYGLACSALG
jgi:hypothetical protein